MRSPHRLPVLGWPWVLLSLATSAWAQKLDVKPGAVKPFDPAKALQAR